MQRGALQHIIESLRGALPGDDASGASETAQAARPAFRVPADHYVGAAHHERERAVLFGGMRAGTWRSLPRVIAASASLAPGACLPIDLPGISLILTRGADGVVRGLANACRHRGTRLVDAPCAAKALVCPYHGWTYDLAGALLHAPHASAFGPGDCRDLPTLPVTEHLGMIWLGEGIADYLGGLDADFAALELDRHVVWRTRRVSRRCNWKLVVEAFLEAYHIRVLHRDSIYRFFIDGVSYTDPVGRHVRAVHARRGLRDLPDPLPDDANPRALGTTFYLVFPGTMLVIHPDFVSLILLHPTAVDQTDFEHLMLVPAASAGDTAHWDKSWTLIQEKVFEGEDLWVCEQSQRGLSAGTTDELVFGELETAMRWFHTEIARTLAATPAA